MKWKNKGHQRTTHITVNGVLDVDRTIYWNKQHGSIAPMDALLGILIERYSPGIREMACRLSLNEAFVPGSELLTRTAQVTISPSAIQNLVKHEGRRAVTAIRQGQFGPDWTALDCTGQTLVTGADGVMVPMVTELQKRKRRVSESKNRKEQGRRSTAKPCRPRTGSDGPYKEFKIVSFYDPEKAHMYAVGTSGDHAALGRLMRREAGKLKIDQARHKVLRD